MARPHPPRLRPLDRLESRVVPTVTVVSAHVATFTDVDGDRVRVAVSAGTLSAGLFTTALAGAGDQLQRIDLSGGGFDRADLTLTVRRAPDGDGRVNVGAIDSTGHDLGAVTVPGDLGRLDAGDGTPAAPAVRSLTVGSLGRYGTDTQPAGGTLDLTINGRLGSLVVRGDVVGTWVNVSDGSDGQIGSVRIQGSLVGGADIHRGELYSSGAMGPVRIGGSVVGGLGLATGLIQSDGPLAGLTIGGSLVGGPGQNSGQVYSPAGIGPIRIGGNVLGGTGSATALIATDGALGAVTLGGSLIGGPADNSGVLFSRAGMGVVRIGGDLAGGSVTGTAPSFGRSGLIESVDGAVAGITIGGSVLAGTDTSTAGDLTENASIRVGGVLGFLTVGGSLVGTATPDGQAPVIVAAGGRSVGVPGKTVGRIAVGGRVELTEILVGYDVDLVPRDADVWVGPVTVGGDWVASSLAAGVTDGGDGFGNAGDAVMSGPGVTNGSGTSRIGPIVIGGDVLGTSAAGDHYGFVAQQIDGLRVGGRTYRLTATADDLAVGLTGDVRLLEAA
jgi:hypothetical protein